MLPRDILGLQELVRPVFVSPRAKPSIAERARAYNDSVAAFRELVTRTHDAMVLEIPIPNDVTDALSEALRHLMEERENLAELDR